MPAGGAGEGRISRALRACCDACAVVGGALLLAMAAMTVTSIVGRAGFARPIPGDVELVQLGTAICISLFLPYTQLRGGNIIVDFFTLRASARAKGAMDAFGAFLYTLMMALVAWRLFAGGLSALESQEVTALVGFPLWAAYFLMAPGLALSVAVGAFHTAWPRRDEPVA